MPIECGKGEAADLIRVEIDLQRRGLESLQRRSRIRLLERQAEELPEVGGLDLQHGMIRREVEGLGIARGQCGEAVRRRFVSPDGGIRSGVLRADDIGRYLGESTREGERTELLWEEALTRSCEVHSCDATRGVLHTARPFGEVKGAISEQCEVAACRVAYVVREGRIDERDLCRGLVDRARSEILPEVVLHLEL